MPSIHDTIETSVSTAGVTVLEDHESGASVDTLYNGSTVDYANSNLTNLEGSWLLEANTAFQEVGHATATVSRGNKYTCRVILNTSGNFWFIVGAQDSASANSDGYALRLDEPNNDIDLIKMDSVNGDSVPASSTAGTINTGTEYRLVFEYATVGNPLVIRLLDASDTELQSTSAVDDDFTGGTFGFYSGSSGDAYMDYITEESL